MVMRRVFIAGVLWVMSQAVWALNVQTRGNDVLIEGAVAVSGAVADIRMVERGPDGRDRLVPLRQARGIQVETRGRDVRILDADGGGRYQAVSIEMNDRGNRQSMRIGIGRAVSRPAGEP